jgi:2-oxo-4-hydroxy-4-carboxy-5-ureidoimidazoline decarboxylase
VTSHSLPGLAWLNSAADPEAGAALHAICAARSWGNALLARRPYAGADALLVASDEATAALTDAGLAEAMAGHPPIGRPEPGDATSSREQRGMAGASGELKAEMLELNLAYQDKFGQVFLICATGRTAEEMRDAIRHRIGNTPQQERTIVRQELAKINRLRLTRLAEEGVPTA